MIQLTNHGMYLVDGVPCEQADVAQQEARQGTMGMAYPARPQCIRRSGKTSDPV